MGEMGCRSEEKRGNLYEMINRYGEREHIQRSNMQRDIKRYRHNMG